MLLITINIINYSSSSNIQTGLFQSRAFQGQEEGILFRKVRGKTSLLQCAAICTKSAECRSVYMEENSECAIGINSGLNEIQAIGADDVTPVQGQILKIKKM